MVALNAAYLRAGHLDHGYAITARRAQGATVDRAFVLGCDELYREWGYTALSRHRDEARFHIARGELGLDRDQAPAERARAERQRLVATRTRMERLQRARDAVPRWRQRERGELDRLLELNQSQAGEAEHVCAQARGDHERALDVRRAWIAEHGPDAERFVVIDNEQRRRAVDERDARSRTAGLDRAPDPWSHVLGSVQPGRNLSIER